MAESRDLFDLSGKTAVVTGAAGQLGGQYVRALLDAGARVAALDINLDNPKSDLGSIDSVNLIKCECDVTEKSALRKTLQLIRKKFDTPSILINNAAVDSPPGAGGDATGPFENYPETSWDQVMEANLKGVYLCCQVFGSAMAESVENGSIINISSVYGLVSPDQRIYQYQTPPFTKPVAYSVSKSGVLNLTRYLATYWAEKGIRVNTLTLGGVFNDQDESFLKNYRSKVPLGRMAEAGEYNGAILFLASDASSYMTGSNLVIDGGYTSW